MNINGTFFIQLFHFLIAYCILERFFFRPWLKEMRHEQQQQDKQETLIALAQQNIAKKERFKVEQWQEFQIAFAQSMPPMHGDFQSIVWPLMETNPVTVDKKTLEIFKNEVEKYLMVRVSS